MSTDQYIVYEVYGPGSATGFVGRSGGDLSQPLVLTLSSSDESEIVVPATVEIPAFETMATFPIDIVDDESLDGDQVVTITATAPSFDVATTEMLVLDSETADALFDQPGGNPGDVLTGTVTLSFSDHTEPFTVYLESSSPDEVAPTAVVVPVGSQSADFEIPVTADALAEGPHAVRVFAASTNERVVGNTVYLAISDPGVTTFQPAEDGEARDADRDGVSFEQVTLGSSAISSQAASVQGNWGEARGVIEFDASTLPAGVEVVSAVLTLQVTSTSSNGVTPLVMDVFAYAGNGTVEASDALNDATLAAELTVNPGVGDLKSHGLALDVALVQSLIDDGGYIGFMTALADDLANTGWRVSYLSEEMFSTYLRPSLHLVLAHAPALTSNALAIDEGGTVTLGASQLAATDADTDAPSLVFAASNVVGGQFVIGGAPATTFKQADVIAGLVQFVHDGGESAPSYDMTVSDGERSDGPHAAAVTFTNVNDNAPVVPAGQAFTVSEDAALGAAVGTIAFSDADAPGDSLFVTIVAGNTGGAFAVDDAGHLTVANAAALDYDVTSSYALTVEVFDGVNTTPQTVVVDVLDVDFTKFFVVDATSDATYAYEADGAPTGSESLGSGNTAPRGVTADASGAFRWVIDNNDRVYKYNADGDLLGSWKANGLNTPEGIATNGVDIWIVDRGNDRVYRFAGAAAATSGTRSATASFALPSGNRDAKGITTDGTNLWIVDGRSGSDYVFRYTMSGTSQGSWRLDTSNSDSEGITIDPTNVNAIWVVDRTDRQVYQYAGGAAWTSGNRTADAVFNLSPGNTDPRGIADPPPRLALANRSPMAGGLADAEHESKALRTDRGGRHAGPVMAELASTAATPRRLAADPARLRAIRSAWRPDAAAVEALQGLAPAAVTWRDAALAEFDPSAEMDCDGADRDDELRCLDAALAGIGEN